MTLTGTYARTLDDKHRLAVPKRLREQLGNDDLKSLFVTPETNQSLGLYSPEAFEQFAKRLQEHTSNRADFRNYLRLFYARAEEVELDSQGRIRIPDRLVEYGQLKHDVVLLPFFLDGVAANAKLLLADGMHPNAAGVELMVRKALPAVERFVAEQAAAD